MYGLLGIFIVSNLFFSSSYLLHEKNHRENWRDAVAYTDAQIGAAQRALPGGAIVLTESAVPWAPIHWYSELPGRYSGASTSMQITDASVDEKLSPHIPNTSYFLLYTYLFELSDPERFVEQHLNENGFALSEEKDFRGVGIVRTFEKK